MNPGLRRRISKGLAIVGVLLVATVVLWPVIKSPFCGDDTLDSLHPMRLKYSGESVWSLIWDITNSWRSAQGRFFPGAVAIGVLVHQIFPDLGPYKAVQLFVVLAGLGLFTYVLQLITRSLRAAIVGALLVVSAFQFRVQYDPILQFSIQQPALILLILATVALVISGSREQSNWRSAVAGLTYAMALLTYETTLLMVPMLVALLFIERRSGFIRRSLFVVVPAGIAAMNLVYLRLNTSTTAAGYTSDLSPSRLIPTFLRQSVGALPYSYAQINTPPFIQRFPNFLDIRTARTWVVVVLVITLLALVLRGLPRVNRSALAMLAVSGLSLWALPALVVSQTVRWQQEVVWGNAYVPVYMEYFGFAMTALAVVLAVRNMVMDRPLALRIALATVLISLTVGGAVSASSNNRLAVQQYNPGYLWSRQFFERSIERGAFDVMKDGEALFTPAGQLWFDPAFINWWGGPRLASVVDAIENPEYGNCITNVGGCSSNYAGVFLQYGIYPTEIRATIIGRHFDLAADGQKFTSMKVKNPTVYVELLRSFKDVKMRETRCRSWMVSRGAAQVVSLASDDVSIVRSDGNWCLMSVLSESPIDALTFTAHP